MIVGRAVALRPVEERDHPLIHRWHNEPEVWWWMDHERPLSLEDVAEAERKARDEGHPFVIEVDGRPIGRIALEGFRGRDRIASLTVFIGDPAVRSKGFGRDAVTTLLGYAFSRLDLRRVEVWSLATNERAMRAFRACGFELEATLPERSFKDGRWIDRVVMSIARERSDQIAGAGGAPPA